MGEDTVSPEPHILDSENEFNEREARRANIILLVTHVVLLILFFVLQVWVMVVVNVCSIIAYVSFFQVVRKRIDSYMMCAQTEIIVHMIFAVLCLGLDYGFQVYCFALATTAFYTSYLNRRVHNKKDPTVLLFVIGVAALFIVFRLVMTTFPPLYTLPYPGISEGFFCANAVITFTLIIYYMNIFARVVAESENQLERDAETDRLTSLANHGHMAEVARGMFAEADKYGLRMAVALMDVDDFKQTNDRYGHAAGDYVLSAIAQDIGTLQNANIHAGRWGGEEFLVVASGSDAYPKLRARLQGLVSRLAGREFTFEDQRITVTITCGITARQEGESFEETFKRADSLMYIGKARGKNCLVNDENSRHRTIVESDSASL